MKTISILWKFFKNIFWFLTNDQKYKIRTFFLKFLINFGISNSENRMDKEIIKLFKYKKKGFFIEVGAYDGIHYSNTLLLEKKYLWKGLLIEPLKKQFNICKNYRKNSIVENYILSSEQDNGKFLNIHKSGLESIVVNKNKSLMPEFHLDNKSNLDFHKVETTTLDSLLKKNNIKKVDILIVDVEGFEINLLEGYNDLIKIEYILIETFDEHKIIQYFKKRNWKLIRKLSYKDYLFQSN